MNTLTRPKSVKIAVVLFIISIVIGVVYSLFFHSQAEIQEHISELQKQLNETPPNGADANPEKASALEGKIGGYLWSIFLLVLIYLIYLGKNWARVVMLIFAIVSFIAFLLTEILIFNISTGMEIITGITYLLNMIAAVLLFIPPSNHWFKYKKNKVSV